MSRRTGRVVALGLAGCAVIAASNVSDQGRRLIYNTTASAPLGFYWLENATPAVGDMAVVRPPPELARWLAQRRYLPLNVPLLKPVAAVGGMRVCGVGGVVRIDGVAVARALAADRWGRRLSAYGGCRPLAADEVFLLNPAAPASLDGRYFGPLPREAVVGRARRLWTWER